MPKVKCEFCGAFIDENAEKCPNCGAVNAYYKRFVSDTPQTIKDLKDWYMARKLPPESVTRFFIGKDIKEPKAFGIYQDGSNFIVYKNKADGSRSIRYKGTDEAYAVNELYLKLKAEILNQKSRSLQRSSSGGNNEVLSPINILMAAAALVALSVASFVIPKFLLAILFASFFILLSIVGFKSNKFALGAGAIMFAAVIILIVSIFFYSFIHRHDGYYSAGGTYYYFQGDDVYYYADDDWYYYDSYDDFTATYPNHEYIGDEYQGDEYYSDFSDSYYYDDLWGDSDSDSDSHDWSSSDNDYDWDSGSDWDSGGSDWDSDW